MAQKENHPFQRLHSKLSVLIASLPAGERFPAEPVLAKQLGVSRATLREVMRAFEGQGLIRRRQGVGTFVVGRGPVIDSGLEVLESIEHLAARIGLDVAMGDLHIDELRADAEIAEGLGIEPDSVYIQITRTITAQDRPVAYLVDRLPEDVLMPSDLVSGFTGSVLDLLLRRGDPPLNHSVAEIRAVAAPAEVARALEIQRGDVLLMFSARLVTDEDRTVDTSLSYFLPGYFRFHVVRKIG